MKIHLVVYHSFMLLIYLLLLSGCSTILSSTDKSTDHKNLIILAKNVNFSLSSPPVALVGTSQSHLVEINFNGQQQRFIAQVEYETGQISCAAISVSGYPLFDFIWHETKGVTINEYVPLPEINVLNIIADMQWINWPIAQLKAEVSGDKVSVNQHLQDENNWLRIVEQNNKIILTVKKAFNKYHLEHQVKKYSLDITDLTGTSL